MSGMRGSLQGGEGGGGFENCVIDVGVGVVSNDQDDDDEPESPIHLRPKVIEINPFLPTTDGALFSWETKLDLFQGTRNDDKIVYPILRANDNMPANTIPRVWPT